MNFYHEVFEWVIGWAQFEANLFSRDNGKKNQSKKKDIYHAISWSHDVCGRTLAGRGKKLAGIFNNYLLSLQTDFSLIGWQNLNLLHTIERTIFGFSPQAFWEKNALSQQAKEIKSSLNMRLNKLPLEKERKHLKNIFIVSWNDGGN